MNLTDFSKHHDPLKLLIRVRQALHITSTTGTRIVCLFLLRTFTSEVSNLITVVTRAFLIGVSVLGFGALSWTFLAFLATSLVGFGTSSLPQSDLSSSTHDRQHPSRAHSDPPLAMDQFKSKCSRKEASGRWLKHDSQFDCI